MPSEFGPVEFDFVFIPCAVNDNLSQHFGQYLTVIVMIVPSKGRLRSLSSDEAFGRSTSLLARSRAGSVPSLEG